MHCQALARHQNMGARKAAFFTQRHGRAFMQKVARWQLVAAHRGIGRQGACAAFDVDPAIGARCAGVGRHSVQCLLVFHQVFGQRSQPGGALLKVKRQQAWQTDCAGMVHGFCKIRCFGMRAVDRFAIDGAAQGLPGLLANPAASDVTLKGGGHGGGIFFRFKNNQAATGLVRACCAPSPR